MNQEEITEAAKILAVTLNRPVYITSLRGGKCHQGQPVSALTLERDEFNSEFAVQPDGTVLACDQLT